MSENTPRLEPCPFCGKEVYWYNDWAMNNHNPLVVEKDAIYYDVRGHDPDCIFNHMVFLRTSLRYKDKMTERWNTRKGEPRRCCANCKHCDVWDQGFDEMPYIKCGNPEKRDDWGKDHDLPRGVIVCEKWESVVKWEDEE